MALKDFENAAQFLSVERDTELYSLVFNNAGVALLAVAETEHELHTARFWLRRAHDAALFGEKPTAGALLAMHNMQRIDGQEPSPLEGSTYRRKKKHKIHRK